MKNILLIILIFLPVMRVSGQFNQSWIHRYDGTIGSGEDRAYNIALDSIGSVYVAGNSWNGNTFELVIIKYNSAGNIVWKKIFAPELNSYPNSIAVDTDNNIYIAGYVRESNYKTKMMLLKYNSSGDMLWQKISEQAFNSIYKWDNIYIDNQNNIYVTGKMKTNSFVVVISKYNPVGNLLWNYQRSFDLSSSYYNSDYDIIIKGSGSNYIIAGATIPVRQYGSECLILKLEANGNYLWGHSFNSVSDTNDFLTDIDIDNNNNIYITSGNNKYPGYLTKIIKYDQSGNNIFIKQFTGIPFNRTNSTALLDNYIIISLSYGSNSNYIYKMNINGETIWGRAHSDLSNVVYTKIMSDGSIYTAGRINQNYNVSDYRLNKYDANGVLLYNVIYNGPYNGDDALSSVVIDKFGGIYLTGSSMGAGTHYDFCTIKYNDPIGIEPISKNIPDEFELYQNYPNPFNPKTVISFSIGASTPGTGKPLSNRVRLVIYDVMGREVEMLVNEQVQPGKYEVEWDGSLFASGLYFYSLVIDNNIIATKKMMLIK